jgi:hypothetical protein
MKSILLFFAVALSVHSGAQYTGVRAKYVDTRLVPKPGFPDTRENRLVLSFYNVDYDGNWTAISMTDYDMYVKAGGVQVAGWYPIDSTGSNYPGYSFTAPVVASYFNTLGPQYFDCGTYGSVHLVANGHELDCGFLTVSEWLLDYDDNQYEQFNTIEVALPYYWWPNPLATYPGNLNFGAATTAGAYNYYNFSCGGSLQLVNRGTMASDSGFITTVLPVRFTGVRGELRDSNASIDWSNMTESDISVYTVERSVNGSAWLTAGTVLPEKNDDGRADYNFQTIQAEETCYYRIKATENSGSFFYSNIFVLRKQTNPTIPQETSGVLSIYPNPVLGQDFTFRLTNAEKGRYVSVIITPDGKQVKQKMIEHDGGDLVRQVETAGLFPGVYRLVIRSANYKYAQTFLYGY